jgi:hypothetical protein
MHTIEWVLLAVVVVGVVAAVLGWDRYRRKPADESSQPTDEVFTDPASGQQMRVWYNAATGERQYRPD